MSWMRQLSDADTIEVRDALVLLQADPGSVCPVCDAVELAERRWLFWLGQEGYQDQGALRQFRASLGLCTGHTRRLLEMGLPWVGTTVLTQVVDAALQRLRGGITEGGAGCPACQELARSQGFTLATLVDGLADTRVCAAYQERDGLCVPHTLAAISAAVSAADAQAARLLAVTLGGRLGRPGRAALATLAGRPGPNAGGPNAGGPGAVARGSPRTGPPGSLASTPTSTLRRLQGDLAVGACPACLRAARMEHRYVCWLAADADRAREAIAREGVEVCGDHLHTLAAVDAQVAGAVAGALAVRADGALAGFETDLAALPPTTIGGRLLAAVTRWRPNRPVEPAVAGGQVEAVTPAAGWAEVLLRPYQQCLDEARQALLRQPGCRVCQERDATAARTIRLLEAALADAPTARAYEASPGLCARHALVMVGADHDADAGVLVRRVAVARLGVLAWELGEAARKRAWSQRHEPSGPEADAWLRGAALVDGMIHLAGPVAQPSQG